MTDSPDDRTAVRSPNETPTVALAPGDRVHAVVQLTPGAILGDRYRIVSKLGTGGMGEVYRADDLKLGQPIALKFLARADRSRERELFDEVRIGRQLAHPNLCRLYDIAEADGRIFITMELVDGEDLASLLRRIGRLPADKAVTVARDLCAGLAAAHEKGVIHRDLKPGNVMLDGRGRARITDFGLAVGAERDPLHPNAGTPGYMAPEQLAGAPAGIRTDLYSLGVVLYEIFTGKRAFSGKTLDDIASQQRTARLAPPSEHVSDIEPRVERVILRCLAVDPSDRPASVDEIAHELPGFDPLAAAIAAGETPSPAMVAAASERGDLPLRVAVPLLLVLLAALVAAAAMFPATALLHRTLPKPPDVMLERVGEILADAGAPPAADRSWWYEQETGASPKLFFRYRQSSQPMNARGPERRVTALDPPFVAEGMVMVTLDAAGSLRELAVVPPKHDPSPPRPRDWSKLIAHTGLAAATPTQPAWSAPVDSDTKRAWSAGDRRIEAASHRGRVAWLAVLPAVPAPAKRGTTAMAEAIESVVLILMMLIIGTLAALVARNNLRRGQGHVRGAWLYASFGFLVMGGAILLRAHHVAVMREELVTFMLLVSQATFWAAICGALYLAVEPLVRRRWPRMLITLTRLMQGRFSDPMFGRDLMAGVATGLAMTVAAHLSVLIAARAGFQTEPLYFPPSGLGGLNHALYHMIFNLATSAVRAIGLATLLLLVRFVVRSDRATFIICVPLLALAALNLGGGPLPALIVFAIAVAIANFALLFRFGIVAVAASAFSFLLLRNVPLTLDPSLWYFGRSLFALAIVAAMALYGFRTATAGKRWLPRVDD